MTDKPLHEMTSDELKAHVAAGGDLADLIPHMTPGEPVEPVDPASVPMVVKAFRLPVDQFDWLVSQNHPDGYSGMIRHAITELQRTTNEAATAPVPVSEAEHALDVLTRIVHQQRAA